MIIDFGNTTKVVSEGATFSREDEFGSVTVTGADGKKIGEAGSHQFCPHCGVPRSAHTLIIVTPDRAVGGITGRAGR